MALFLTHNDPLWGVWKMEECTEELLSRLNHPLLPPDIRSERRRQEWLAVRVLLKELLGEETQIAYRPNGAPYLPDRKLHISISHTKGYVAVMLDERFPVGIDVEYLSDRVHKIRSRFLCPEEEEMIDAVHETEHLLVCWCAKETLFKLISQSEIDLRWHLRLFPFAYNTSGCFIAETRKPHKALYALSYIVNKYFVMTWSLDMTVVRCPSLLNSTIMVLLFLMR